MICPFKSCHITVNRACNARCSFCYANTTNFKKELDMKPEVFDSLVNICDEANIQKIILIGGEPTVYPHIHDSLKKLKDKSKHVTIVTNGILLSDIETCNRYLDEGVSIFSVAIKAHDQKSYQEITKVDAFDKVLACIRNLSKLKAKFSVSYVITNENIDHVLDMMKIAMSNGAKNFFFSFCRNLNLNGVSDKTYINDNNPIELAEKFEKILPEMKKLGANFSYAINEPLCVYSIDFLDKYLEDDFKRPCYVFNESSLTFNTNGDVIPFNTMFTFDLLKYGEDFHDLKTLLACREQNAKYREAYSTFRGIPSEYCLSCNNLGKCFGRCVCNWTNYTFKELSDMKRNHYLHKCKCKNVLKNNDFQKIFDEIDNSYTLNKNVEAFNLIIGKEGYKKNNRHTRVLTTNISDYRNLSNGTVAFIPGNRSFPSSAIHVLTLLFGSINFAYLILDYFTTTNQINKLLIYLFNKGYLLLNLLDINLNNLEVNYLSCAKINNILICHTKQTKNKTARNPFQNIEVLLKKHGINSLYAIHPSAINMGDLRFFNTWIMRTSINTTPIYLDKNSNEDSVFKAFKII